MIGPCLLEEPVVSTPEEVRLCDAGKTLPSTIHIPTAIPCLPPFDYPSDECFNRTREGDERLGRLLGHVELFGARISRGALRQLVSRSLTSSAGMPSAATGDTKRVEAGGYDNSRFNLPQSLAPIPSNIILPEVLRRLQATDAVRILKPPHHIDDTRFTTDHVTKAQDSLGLLDHPTIRHDKNGEYFVPQNMISLSSLHAAVTSPCGGVGAGTAAADDGDDGDDSDAGIGNDDDDDYDGHAVATMQSSDQGLSSSSSSSGATHTKEVPNKAMCDGDDGVKPPPHLVWTHISEAPVPTLSCTGKPMDKDEAKRLVTGGSRSSTSFMPSVTDADVDDGKNDIPPGLRPCTPQEAFDVTDAIFSLQCPDTSPWDLPHIRGIIEHTWTPLLSPTTPSSSSSSSSPSSLPSSSSPSSLPSSSSVSLPTPSSSDYGQDNHDARGAVDAVDADDDLVGTLRVKIHVYASRLLFAVVAVEHIKIMLQHLIPAGE